MMALENILLLSCRSPFLDDSKVYAPMANLYLKSYIEREVPNIKVTLGDDNYKFNKEYFKDYDLIGLSVMTPQREEAYKICNFIKENFPEKKVVIGGPHVKHYIGEVVKQKNFDFIVPLDGEKPLTAIVKGETNRFPKNYTRSSISIQNGIPKHVIMENITDERILRDVMSKDDIERAPRPDRSSVNAIEVIKKYHYKLGGRESTTMMTARGCPERCSFCEDAMTPVKWSSLDSIIGQLDDIKKLGYGGVYLFDDLFGLALPKIKPICEEMKKRDLIFRCNAQARYFTKWGEEMAEMLARTGCHEIAFGMESGSQKILNNINKRTTVELNYKTIQYANKYGIKVKAFTLIGLPGEDKETLKDTEKIIKFLMESNPENDFGCYVFYPYKGTQIRDALDRGEDPGLNMLKEEGLGAYGQTGGNTEAGVIKTESLSNKELVDFRDYLVERYHPRSSGEKWKDKQNKKYRQE